MGVQIQADGVGVMLGVSSIRFNQELLLISFEAGFWACWAGPSERDVVLFLEFVRRGRRAALRGRGALLGSLRGGMRAAAAGVALAIGHELEVVADDFEAAAFFTGFLVIPGVHLEAAFDVGAAALGEVLLGEFGLAAPEGDIDEGGVFLFLSLFVVPDAVDGEGDVRDGFAAGGVAQFGISGEIADEHDFVEIGHSEWEDKSKEPGTTSRNPVPANPFNASSEALEMLEMDVTVKAETLLDFRDRAWSTKESVIDVMTGLEVA